MKRLFEAFGSGFVYIFSHRKILMALIFVFTTGNNFNLPEWANVMLELVAMFTIVLVVLKSTN